MDLPKEIRVYAEWPSRGNSDLPALFGPVITGEQRRLRGPAFSDHYAGESAGIVKLRPTAVFDAQHGGFTAGSSPVSWGAID